MAAAAASTEDSLKFNATECMRDTSASTADVQVLRLNLTDPEAAEEWLRQYSAASNTSWIVKHSATKYTK
ncbi:hypothetical protein MTO96_027045 [Rhipicephalus appendiculatus]